ncbi:MAG: tetratricopeptide repeat protein [Myxococcales bacterium]|nr:tetratricopeptide repeat protein [Myxococcales bacterium]
MKLGLGLVMALGMLAMGCMGASQEDAKVAQAEYGLANDAFARSSYREALDHVEKALEADEENAEAAYLGAMIYLVFCASDDTSPDCRYDQAEAYARKALEADPNMRDATNVLGVILVHRGEAAEAAKILDPLAHDMLYRSPEKAWGNLGWAHLEAGQVDEAIPALRRSVAAQPLFCVGHYRLGLAYEKKGEMEAASQAFSRAVSIEEGDCGRLQDAFWGLARVSEKLGRVAVARENLEQCQKLAAVSEVGKKCATKLRHLP